MKIERPIDFLNELKGHRVIVKLKGSDNLLYGELITFDIHINLLVKCEDGLTFIKGDNIISIG